MRSSGKPGLVLTGTQASSGNSGTVLANARVLCKSTKCSSETGVQPIHPKQPLGVLPIPRGSATPSKSTPKGSAGLLKTAASNDDSSSSRCSPRRWWWMGSWWTSRGFTPSSRPQVPPTTKVPDRQSKVERNLVLSNQYFALSDVEMESSSVLQSQNNGVYFIIQRFLRGF